MTDGEYISLHVAEPVQSFLFALQFEAPRLVSRNQDEHVQLLNKLFVLL